MTRSSKVSRRCARTGERSSRPSAPAANHFHGHRQAPGDEADNHFFRCTTKRIQAQLVQARGSARSRPAPVSPPRDPVASPHASATLVFSNHVHIVGREDIGCLPADGMRTMHIDTTLLILLNALCADARLQAPSLRTKMEQRRASQCASRTQKDGDRRGSHRKFQARRTMPNRYRS
jgi:hypothetical protein